MRLWSLHGAIFFSAGLMAAQILALAIGLPGLQTGPLAIGFSFLLGNYAVTAYLAVIAAVAWFTSATASWQLLRLLRRSTARHRPGVLRDSLRDAALAQVLMITCTVTFAYMTTGVFNECLRRGLQFDFEYSDALAQHRGGKAMDPELAREGQGSNLAVAIAVSLNPRQCRNGQAEDRIVVLDKDWVLLIPAVTTHRPYESDTSWPLENAKIVRCKSL
jgi:hypothetical protein